MDLRDSVIRTVAYFDIFDYPLTRGEIWMYLVGASGTLGETDLAIDGLLAEKKIEEKNGVVFFAGRKNIQKTREERYRPSREALDWRAARLRR